MSPGLFITFEGTEGSGKSTQIALLAARLRALSKSVCLLREPGGTPIGEEIRHTIQHSFTNQAMTPEAELLLINASRAQLVREVIRPALEAGEIVLCDRFYDSTTAYQGYGRGLDLAAVKWMIDFAVGNTRPKLTIYLHIPLQISEERRRQRRAQQGPTRDRMEEADPQFFERVEQGFLATAAKEPDRVRTVDATGTPETVQETIWDLVSPLIHRSCAGATPEQMPKRGK